MAVGLARLGLGAALRVALADGAWHSLAELCVAVSGYIRPEVAARMGHRPGAPEADLATVIDRGRRKYVCSRLHEIGAEADGGAGGQQRWRQPAARCCAACGRSFMPLARAARFCSQTCVARDRARRLPWTVPSSARRVRERPA